MTETWEDVTVYVRRAADAIRREQVRKGLCVTPAHLLYKKSRLELATLYNEVRSEPMPSLFTRWQRRGAGR